MFKGGSSFDLLYSHILLPRSLGAEFSHPPETVSVVLPSCRSIHRAFPL